MKTFLYAAYGSNLHPVRLRAADRCPSAKLIGTCVITEEMGSSLLLTHVKVKEMGSSLLLTHVR